MAAKLSFIAIKKTTSVCVGLARFSCCSALQAEAERRLARAKQIEPSWAQAPSSGRKRMRVEEDEDEDEEMRVIVFPLLGRGRVCGKCPVHSKGRMAGSWRRGMG